MSSKIMILLIATILLELNAFQVVDVLIPIQMKRGDEQVKTFVVDVGERNRIAKTGDLLTVLRKDEYGSLFPVGVMEIVSTANSFSKAKVKIVADDLLIKPFGIQGIAVGDSVFPLVMLSSKTLFGELNTAILTKNGMDLLAEKVVSYLHEGNFKNIILFSYSDRGLIDQKEIAFAEAQGIAIKKYLMGKHGIAEGLLKISASGKNNPFSKLLSGSRHDFLFAFDPNYEEKKKIPEEIITESPKIEQTIKDEATTGQNLPTKIDSTTLTKPKETNEPGELILREEDPAKEISEPDSVKQLLPKKTKLPQDDVK